MDQQPGMLGIATAGSVVVSVHHGKPIPEEARAEIEAVQRATRENGETSLVVVLDKIGGVPGRDTIRTYRDAAKKNPSVVSHIAVAVLAGGVAGTMIRGAASAILKVMPNSAKVFGDADEAIQWISAKTQVSQDDLQAALDEARQGSR